MRQPNKILYIVLAFVLIIWPIYWLPGINLSTLTHFKNFGLFILICIPLLHHKKTAFILSNKNNYFNNIIILISLILISSFPSILLSDNLFLSFFGYIRLIVIFPLFIYAYSLFKIDHYSINHLYFLMTLPVLISVFAVLISKAGFIHLDPPSEFIRAYGSEGYLMGFSYRTPGLAYSIAYVIPAISYFAICSSRITSRVFWSLSLALSLFVCSMLLNRAGFISSVLSVFLVFTSIFRSRRSLWVTTISLVSLITFVLFYPQIIATALYRSAIDPASFANDFSSGRISLLKDALIAVENIPFFGYGYHQSVGLDYISTASFHNLYITHMLSTGIVSGIFIAIFMLYVFKVCFTAYLKVATNKLPDFAIVPISNIFTHLISTFIENGAMFYSIYLGLSFWFSLAYIIFIISNPNNISDI